MTTQAAVGDDVRERVARAIYEASQPFARAGCDTVPLWSEGQRQIWLTIADAAIASVPPEPVCDLCVGECRGHSLGHPEEWEPEPGSKAAVPPVPIDDAISRRAVLDALHEQLPYPTEACAIVRALHPNHPSDRK
jgi:hypothetical protein